MAVDRLALDPTIAVLADFAASLGAPKPVAIVRIAPGVVVFATDPRFVASGLALFMSMCAMLVATTLAPAPVQTPKAARGIRSLAIQEGVVPRPKRETADDRRRAEAARWGWA